MVSEGAARDGSASRQAFAGDTSTSSISRLFDGHAPTTVLHGIYDVAGTPSVHGWEALMRGPRGLPFEGPMLAFAFAHSFDLLAELDLECLRCALTVAPRERLLFLNVHPTTLLGRGAGAFAELVVDSPREPGDVVLEIVEHGTGREAELLGAVGALRRAGFRIAVDDFGRASRTSGACCASGPTT